MEEILLNASTDDLQLSVLCCKPTVDSPLGIVQIVHDMCEHKERYLPFINYLQSKGYMCVIHDHRGHGKSIKSPGDLGYMYRGGWRALVEDIRIVNDWAAAQYPSLKYVMIAHGMGSLAARCFLKNYDNHLDGLILTGSPSENNDIYMESVLAKILSFYKEGRYRSSVLNKMTFVDIDFTYREEKCPHAWIASDKEVVKQYNEDPLCNFVFTVNGFKNLFSLMRNCYSLSGWKKKNVYLPIYFFSGVGDPFRISFNRFINSVTLMRGIGYKNLYYDIFEGRRHDIFNDRNKENVWRFLNVRIDSIKKNIP